jgi:hypothetical protein
MMTRKMILGAATLAMTIGLASASLPASAKDRFPDIATATDTDKDGMISKEEFLAMAAKMYDDKMAAMKKMSATDQAKMLKDYRMTFAGYQALWKEFAQ